jgi:hypothetical protein
MNTNTKIAVDWNLVASGLPDDGMLVLVALNDNDVWTGYRDGDIWRYADAMPIKVEHVTHWAHMPAHPSEEIEASPVALLPLNEHTRMILGRPNFACVFTAQRMRDLGHKINRTSTAEQAAVLHLLVNMYQQHGADWFEHVSAYLGRCHPQTAATAEKVAA